MWNSGALKERLELEGRTRKWLAEQVGITLGTLNQIAMGRHKPGLPVLKLMAIALNCKVSDLDPLSVPSTRETHRASLGRY